MSTRASEPSAEPGLRPAPFAPVAWRHRSGAALAILAFLALWEAAPRLGLVDTVFLPPFTEVARRLVGPGRQRSALRAPAGQPHPGARRVRDRGRRRDPARASRSAGTARSREFLNPMLELFRNTAALALLPVFILILGIGETSKIALVIYACFFPILLNTITGVRTVDPLLIKSARSLGLRPPAAVPEGDPAGRGADHLHRHPDGRRASSILVLIAAEMVGAKAGLGYLITASQLNFQIPDMYAGIITIALVGLAFNAVLAARRAPPLALAPDHRDPGVLMTHAHTAPQRLPHGRRPPRGRLASPAHRPGPRADVAHYLELAPDRRTRHARLGVLRRRPGRRAERQAQHPGGVRADHAAVRDRGRHRRTSA